METGEDLANTLRLSPKRPQSEVAEVAPPFVPGWDWQADLPGDRSDLIWDGYIPYADGPKLVNPESGFIFDANNTPFRATDGADNLTPEQFPAWMGLQTNETNRSLPIQELTDGTQPIDRGRSTRVSAVAAASWSSTRS